MRLLPPLSLAITRVRRKLFVRPTRVYGDKDINNNNNDDDDDNKNKNINDVLR